MWKLAKSLEEKKLSHTKINRNGCTRGVMVIIVGYGHSDTSSNPGQD